MILVSWKYRGDTFYQVFELFTQFNPEYVEKTLRMNPEEVSDVKIVAKGRTSFPAKGLMVA